VFRHAVGSGRAKSDPSRDLRGSLDEVERTHFAAITKPAAVAELLRAIDGYKGSHITLCALRLAPLVFVRPGELRGARWADIDLEKAEWCFVPPKTRKKRPDGHIVPLSTQAVAILRELHSLTGTGHLVFPSSRTKDRQMSENTVLAALRRLGVGKDEMSGHGFRAMARTILDEVLGVRVDFIEHQLAHEVRDTNGRSYNRTTHLVERHKMMQQWADYLDRLKAGTVASVTRIGARA
jgi:integrase